MAIAYSLSVSTIANVSNDDAQKISRFTMNHIDVDAVS